MILQKITKQRLPFIVVLGLAVVLVLLGATAYALSGKGYFTGSSISVGLADDVVLGRPHAVPANTYSSAYTQAQRKANYIAWLDTIVRQNAAGTGQTYTGGAFIVNTMLGRSSHTRTVTTAMWNDLKARINSPDMNITYETSKDANTTCTAGSNCPISFYDPGKDDDFFATYNAGLGTIIEFKNKGVLVYALEETCGNPVGGLPGLPAAPAILAGYKLDVTTGSTSGAAYKSLNVAASNAGSTTANPFFFNGSAGNGGTIAPGARTVSVAAPAASSGYKYIGYTICVTSSSSCTAAYLNNKANIRGTGYNFSYTFVSGASYAMRWLYEKSSVVTNGPPSNSFSVSCASNLTGTAIDPDNTGHSISVDIYEGSTANKIATVTTNATTGAYSYNVSSLILSSSHSFYTVARGINAAGSPDGLDGAAVGPQSAGPCVSSTSSCLTSNFSTATMIVGISYNFQVKTSVSPWASPPYTAGSNPAMYVQLKDPTGAYVINSPSVGYSVSGSSPGTLTSATQTFTPSKPGVYQLVWGLTGSSLDVSCPASGSPDTNTAAYAPFFTTTGGDIMADGDITSWNRGPGAGYVGAGGQLAAIASGDINQFVTGGALPGGVSANSGKGLGFANTTAVPGNGKYGGGFGVIAYTPDIPTQTNTLSGSVDLGGLTTGTYYASSTVQLYGTVKSGQIIDIVVTSGDAFITGDITYNYADSNSIPRLNLYVESGDIVVRHDVSEIHGVLYASGNFVSCGDNSGADMNMSSATAYTSCNSKLTVYGAVAAHKLVLHRTYGNLVASGGVPYAPAEEFIYSPEVWLAKGQSVTGSGDVKYDSYVSLPPIL